MGRLGIQYQLSPPFCVDNLPSTPFSASIVMGVMVDLSSGEDVSSVSISDEQPEYSLKL
jgi:hypothetical protein